MSFGTIRNEAGAPSASPGFYEECVAALGGLEDDAVLMLDDRGNVVYCNASAACLMGRDTRVVVGQPIRSLIPAFPFNPAAPGSNVAQASHWGRTNRWRRFALCSAQGDDSAIELRLDALMVGLRYLILTWLRPTAAHRSSFDADAGDAVPNGNCRDSRDSTL